MTTTAIRHNPRGATILALGVLGAALLGGGEAAAQAACAPRADLAKQLESRYGERPTGLGLSGRQRLIEFYRTEDGQTWTLVATDAQGRSCIVEAGSAWAERAARTPGLGVAFEGQDGQ
jgi:hypothetical protein